jgi:ribose 5-phosphate isomerase A
LTREKIVATASRRMVVVADEGKLVGRLGSTFPLPIEVLALAKTPVRRRLESWGAQVGLRMGPDGAVFRTDNGNPILDAKWPAIEDPEGLHVRVETTPGVVCCGLFLGLCNEAFVAGRSFSRGGS